MEDGAKSGAKVDGLADFEEGMMISDFLRAGMPSCLEEGLRV